MHELLPIIRRKRRPLIVVEPALVVVGNVEPSQPVTTKPPGEVADKQNPQASDRDADN